MKSSKAFVVLGTVIVMFFSLTNVLHANLINGDFSDGLNGWTTEGEIIPEGDVQVVNREAILGDTGEYWSALYQPLSLASGEHRIEFDFKNALSDDPDVPSAPFPFYDSFFASIYFVDDVSQFNLDLDPVLNVFDDSLALFDMDAAGAYIINGIIGSSSKGQDWQHFSASFNNTYAYVIPTFELLEMNFIDGDSQVLIDNVSLNPVPEPATLLLFGAGLAALTGLARKKHKLS